mgnify:CR=1 FL=1
MAKKEKKEVKNNKDKTSFMKSFKAELKKVNWPTPKQLFNNTVAVLTIVLITAVIVFVLDFAFESMNKYGINKVKEVVSNSTTNETSDENNETSENTETSEEIVEENVDTTDENVTEGSTENIE